MIKKRRVTKKNMENIEKSSDFSLNDTAFYQLMK